MVLLFMLWTYHWSSSWRNRIDPMHCWDLSKHRARARNEGRTQGAYEYDVTTSDKQKERLVDWRRVSLQLQRILLLHLRSITYKLYIYLLYEREGTDRCVPHREQEDWRWHRHQYKKGVTLVVSPTRVASTVTRERGVSSPVDGGVSWKEREQQYETGVSYPTEVIVVNSNKTPSFYIPTY